MDRCTLFIKWIIFFSLLLSVTARSEPLSSHYAATPPLLSKTSEPLVMLVLSVDHELFKKAYSDYTDLDADGRIDITYNDNFDYLGYFDSEWCYSYSGLGYYRPQQLAGGANNHFCTTSTAPWSGNFLNWATMSRIDILRRVLFGGKRFTDSSSQTVLERSYIPRDVHSFVKVYDSTATGIPAQYLTPYLDTSISLCNVSSSENGYPEVRVASDVWPRWASTEVKQCQWGALNSPDSSYQLSQNRVRIEVCVQGKDADTSTRCKEYPNGSSKPSGLLQQYGEGGDIRFGLMSGSYDKNISGGVLRKNIGKVSGNTNDSEDEINLANGQFNDTQGIIETINQIRIAKYSYSQNKYIDCNTYGISVSSFKNNRSATSNRHCSMWGNPLSELYMEALRYFSGTDSATPAFDASSDHQFINDLRQQIWAMPMNADNPCASCSIILLSTGLNSFDTDELGNSADIPGLTGINSVNSKTDAVGNLEFNGSFSGHYLTGGTGTTRHCTAKYLTGLSQAIGLCPEIPQLEGGYQIAGLSWHANSSDLRPELSGKQQVKTYAIELAESVPNFTLTVNGKPLTFQPVCQTSSNFASGSSSFSGSGSDCTLTDVVIERLNTDSSGQVIEGQLLFTWEDSLWGNDYDYDASSRIKFCVGQQCNQTADADLHSSALSIDQVKIAVQVDGVFAGLNMRFSYTITGSGAGTDGLQSGFVYKGSSNFITTTFFATGQAAGVLPKPLFLAAKYGGYSDLDGDGTPAHHETGNAGSSDSREWDNRNNHNGSLGADGIPDNYYFSRNPSLLEAQLGQVLSDISSRVSSATNAALFANSSTGVGALYQALFQPEQEVNGNVVRWGGILHALFVDSKGFLREDTNSNDALDDYDTDKIVELFFDPNAGQTMVQRFRTDDEGDTTSVEGVLKPLSSLKSLWDAREQLSLVTNITLQRTYGALASGGRHILTWLDLNNDLYVDHDEQLAFTADTFTGQAGYLGVPASEINKVVNYVRGQEQAGTRSRTIDYDENGSENIWRLGDIVHSTPRLSSAPDSRFDASFSDSSYKTFRDFYLKRRHVLYVGANDGLIHAFNGGFWNQQNFSYERSGDKSEALHPLGSELWAYAPMNLLPHLRWLTESDYPHVYYMDGEPLVFDANIFPDNPDHPGGWGTVLVMGMRLGGGEIAVDVNGTTKTMRSAYVVLDITNPEKPPELIAEITHPDLGFTTSKPVMAKMRAPGVTDSGEKDWSEPIRNDWYLVFGSGPKGSTQEQLREVLDEGKAGQNLHLFVYDLNNRNFVSGLDPLTTSYPESYAGDMTVTDWDNDYIDDMIYFGTVETGGDNLGGMLMRFKLNTVVSESTLGVLMDADLPIMAEPLTIADKDSYWIYSGTGRLLTLSDNRNQSANFFYGIREPVNALNQLSYDTVNPDDLVDTSQAEVLTNGIVRRNGNQNISSFSVGSDTIDNFESLKATIQQHSGWKRSLSAGNVLPSGRNINTATRLFTHILFTEYLPPGDACSVDGNSFLYGVHYQTGTASAETVLGVIDLGVELEADLSLNKISLGAGYASSPVVHQGEGGRHTAVTQGAGGSITSDELNYEFSSQGRQSWRQIFSIPFNTRLVDEE